ANHNHFAGYIEMIVPLPIALALTQRISTERRIFYCFAAAIMGIAALASLSRGGVFSMACGLAFVLLLTVKLKKEQRATNQASRGGKAPSRAAAVFSTLLPVALLTAVIAIGVFWIGTDPLVHRASQSQSSEEQSFSATRGWIWRDTLAM